MDAQKLYASIAAKQEAQFDNDSAEVNREDHKMYLRKAGQGHVYGRTKNIFSEEGIKDGRSTSASGERSDSARVRPATESVQHDDSVTEGEPAAADGSTGAPISIATGGADETAGSATERGADSGQRKSARHTPKTLNRLGGAE